MGYLIIDNFFINDSIDLISKNINVNVKYDTNVKFERPRADTLWRTHSTNYKHNVIQFSENDIINIENNITEGSINMTKFCSIIGSGISCEIEQIFIDKNNNIKRLLTYENDTLDIVLYESDNYNSFIINLQEKDDYELFIDPSLNINIIEDQQYTYDFHISELGKVGKNPIPKSDLNKFRNIYIKKNRRGQRIKFNSKQLNLYIHIENKIFR